VNAVLTAQEPSAKYLVNLQPPLVRHFDLIAQAPGGVARLRELILTLAVQGKLVPQDPSDEPAGELLRRVIASVSARPTKTSKAMSVSKETSAPYELPDGWAWCQLGEIVENMGSGWSPACDEGERSDPMRWAVLRTTAVQVNEYRAREHKALPSKLSPRPEIEVKDGDILITRAGPMNRVGISCWINNTPPRLMLSDKIVRFHSVADEMLPAFIVLALNAGWTKDQIEQAKTGMAASQVNISQTDLRGLWLPVCSKAEQSRIVTRVDELMQVCDALEASGQLEAQQHAQLVGTLLGTLTQSETPEALADNWQRIAAHFDLLLDRPSSLDALEQTILQLAVRGLLVPQDPADEPASVLFQKIRTEKDHLIAQGKIKRDKPLPPITDEEKPFELPRGWEWVSLGLLTSLVTSGSRSWKDFYSAEGATFIRSQDIKYDRLEFDERAYVKLPIGREGVRTQVRRHDVLITITGANVSKAAVVAQSMDEAYVSQHVALVRLCDTRLVDFLHLWLVSGDEGRKRLLMSSYGAKPGLNLQNISDLLVPLPPLAEQIRIVTLVNEKRALCDHLRRCLNMIRFVQAKVGENLIAST